MTRLILGLLIASLSGCATAAPTRNVSVLLTEPPATGTMTLGEGDIAIERDTLRWRFSFLPMAGGTRALGVEIENRGADAVVIPWDLVTLVDASGRALRVIHHGVRLTTRDQPMAPSVIPAGGKLADFVYPSARAYVAGGPFMHWAYSPYFEEMPSGGVFSLYMPLKVGTMERPYTFTFQVQEPAAASR